MGEDKNQDCIGPSPHNFRFNLHQNNPLKLVVLRPVWVLMANWLAGVNKLWHHWRDGTDAGTELRRLRRNTVKRCQKEDGTMRSMPWYISLQGIRRGSKIRTLNSVYARLKSKQIEILKPASQGMYQGTLHYCTYETSEVWCTSTSNIESLKLNESFLVLLCTAVCCN